MAGQNDFTLSFGSNIDTFKKALLDDLAAVRAAVAETSGEMEGLVSTARTTKGKVNKELADTKTTPRTGGGSGGGGDGGGSLGFMSSSDMKHLKDDFHRMSSELDEVIDKIKVIVRALEPTSAQERKQRGNQGRSATQIENAKNNPPQPRARNGTYAKKDETDLLPPKNVIAKGITNAIAQGVAAATGNNSSFRDGRRRGSVQKVSLLGTPKVLIQEAQFRRLVDSMDKNTAATNAVAAALKGGIPVITTPGTAAPSSTRRRRPAATTAEDTAAPTTTRRRARRPTTPTGAAAAAAADAVQTVVEKGPSAAQLRSQILRRQRMAALRRERERAVAGEEFDQNLFETAAGTTKKLRERGEASGYKGDAYVKHLDNAISALASELKGVPRVSTLRTQLAAVEAGGALPAPTAGRRRAARSATGSANEGATERAIEELQATQRENDETQKRIAEKISQIAAYKGISIEEAKALVEVAAETTATTTRAAKSQARREKARLQRTAQAQGRDTSLSMEERVNIKDRLARAGAEPAELARQPKAELRTMLRTLQQMGYQPSFGPDQERAGGKTVTRERLADEIARLHADLVRTGETKYDLRTGKYKGTAERVDPKLTRLLSDMIEVRKASPEDQAAWATLSANARSGGQRKDAVDPKMSARDKVEKGRQLFGGDFQLGDDYRKVMAAQEHLQTRSQETIPRAALIAATRVLSQGKNIYDPGLDALVSGKGPNQRDAAAALSDTRRATDAIDRVVGEFIALQKEIDKSEKALAGLTNEQTALERKGYRSAAEADRIKHLTEVLRPEAQGRLVDQREKQAAMLYNPNAKPDPVTGARPDNQFIAALAENEHYLSGLEARDLAREARQGGRRGDKAQLQYEVQRTAEAIEAHRARTALPEALTDFMVARRVRQGAKSGKVSAGGDAFEEYTSGFPGITGDHRHGLRATSEASAFVDPALLARMERARVRYVNAEVAHVAELEKEVPSVQVLMDLQAKSAQALKTMIGAYNRMGLQEKLGLPGGRVMFDEESQRLHYRTDEGRNRPGTADSRARADLDRLVARYKVERGENRPANDPSLKFVTREINRLGTFLKGTPYEPGRTKKDQEEGGLEPFIGTPIEKAVREAFAHEQAKPSAPLPEQMPIKNVGRQFEVVEGQGPHKTTTPELAVEDVRGLMKTLGIDLKDVTTTAGGVVARARSEVGKIRSAQRKVKNETPGEAARLANEKRMVDAATKRATDSLTEAQKTQYTSGRKGAQMLLKDDPDRVIAELRKTPAGRKYVESQTTRITNSNLSTDPLAELRTRIGLVQKDAPRKQLAETRTLGTSKAKDKLATQVEGILKEIDAELDALGTAERAAATATERAAYAAERKAEAETAEARATAAATAARAGTKPPATPDSPLTTAAKTLAASAPKPKKSPAVAELEATIAAASAKARTARDAAEAVLPRLDQAKALVAEYGVHTSPTIEDKHGEVVPNPQYDKDAAAFVHSLEQEQVAPLQKTHATHEAEYFKQTAIVDDARAQLDAIKNGTQAAVQVEQQVAEVRTATATQNLATAKVEARAADVEEQAAKVDTQTAAQKRRKPPAGITYQVDSEALGSVIKTTEAYQQYQPAAPIEPPVDPKRAKMDEYNAKRRAARAAAKEGAGTPQTVNGHPIMATAEESAQREANRAAARSERAAKKDTATAKVQEQAADTRLAAANESNVAAKVDEKAATKEVQTATKNTTTAAKNATAAVAEATGPAPVDAGKKPLFASRSRAFPSPVVGDAPGTLENMLRAAQADPHDPNYGARIANEQYERFGSATRVPKVGAIDDSVIQDVLKAYRDFSESAHQIGQASKPSDMELFDPSDPRYGQKARGGTEFTRKLGDFNAIGGTGTDEGKETLRQANAMRTPGATPAADKYFRDRLDKILGRASTDKEAGDYRHLASWVAGAGVSPMAANGNVKDLFKDVPETFEAVDRLIKESPVTTAPLYRGMRGSGRQVNFDTVVPGQQINLPPRSWTRDESQTSPFGGDKLQLQLEGPKRGLDISSISGMEEVLTQGKAEVISNEVIKGRRIVRLRALEEEEQAAKVEEKVAQTKTATAKKNTETARKEATAATAEASAAKPLTVRNAGQERAALAAGANKTQREAAEAAAAAAPTPVEVPVEPVAVVDPDRARKDERNRRDRERRAQQRAAAAEPAVQVEQQTAAKEKTTAAKGARAATVAAEAVDIEVKTSTKRKSTAEKEAAATGGPGGPSGPPSKPPTGGGGSVPPEPPDDEDPIKKAARLRRNERARELAAAKREGREPAPLPPRPVTATASATSRTRDEIAASAAARKAKEEELKTERLAERTAKARAREEANLAAEEGKVTAAERARITSEATVLQTTSKLSRETQQEIRLLNELSAAQASNAEIAEQQIRVYARMVNEMTDAGASVATAKKAFQEVSGAAKQPVSGPQLNEIGKQATARGYIGENTGDNPLDQFMHKMFGKAGFWGRVANTTGTFVVRNFAAGMVFGLTSALSDVVKQAIETESVFVRVSHALESTGRASGDLRTQLQGISTDYGVSLEDVYNTAAGLTGLFQSTDDIASATRVVSQLQMISNGALNAAEGMGTLASITSAFSEDLGGAGGLEHLADMLTVIQNRTGVNIETTAEGMGRLAGLAQQIGLSAEETGVYVAEISKKTNQTGAASGEQLQRIVAVMRTGRGQKVLRETLGDKGIGSALNEGDYAASLKILMANYGNLTKAQQNNIATTLGGQRQAATLAALLHDGAEALDTVAAATNSKGEADARAAKISKTLNAEIARFQANLVNLGAALVRSGVLSFFGLMFLAVNKTLGVLNQVLSKMNDFADQNPLVSWATRGTIAILGLAMAIRVLGAAKKGIGAWIQASPTGQALTAQRSAAAAAGAGPGFMARTGEKNAVRRERRAAERVAGTRPGFFSTATTRSAGRPIGMLGKGLETFWVTPGRKLAASFEYLAKSATAAAKIQVEAAEASAAKAAALRERAALATTPTQAASLNKRAAAAEREAVLAANRGARLEGRSRAYGAEQRALDRRATNFQNVLRGRADIPVRNLADKIDKAVTGKLGARAGTDYQKLAAMPRPAAFALRDQLTSARALGLRGAPESIRGMRTAAQTQLGSIFGARGRAAVRSGLSTTVLAGAAGASKGLNVLADTLKKLSFGAALAQGAMLGFMGILLSLFLEMGRANQFAKDSKAAYEARFGADAGKSQAEKAAEYIGQSDELNKTTQKRFQFSDASLEKRYDPNGKVDSWKDVGDLFAVYGEGLKKTPSTWGQILSPDNYGKGGFLSRTTGDLDPELMNEIDKPVMDMFKMYQKLGKDAGASVDDVTHIQTATVAALEKEADSIQNDDSLSETQRTAATAQVEANLKIAQKNAEKQKLRIMGLADMDKLTGEMIDEINGLFNLLAASPTIAMNFPAAFKSLEKTIGIGDGNTELEKSLEAMASGRLSMSDFMKEKVKSDAKLLADAQTELDTKRDSHVEEAEIKEASDRVQALMQQVDQDIQAVLEAITKGATDMAAYLAGRGDYGGASEALKAGAAKLKQQADDSANHRMDNMLNTLPGIPASIPRSGSTGTIYGVEGEAAIRVTADQLRAEAAANLSKEKNTGARAGIRDTRNSATIAQLQLDIANQELKDIKEAAAAGGGLADEVEAAQDKAKAALYARDDANQAVRTARLTAQSAGLLNSVSKAQADEGIAYDNLAYARREYTVNSEQYQNALAAARQASQATQSAIYDELAAARETELTMMAPGAAVGRARKALDNALKAQQEAARFGESSTQYQQATQAVIEAQRAVNDAIESVADANSNLAIALAEAAGKTVDVARQKLNDAQEALRRAIAKSGGERSPDVINAEAGVVAANAGVRDAMLQDSLDTIDFQKQMEYITTQGAISMLTELLNMKDLTEQQRRDILLRIKGLQDELSSSMEGAFNLPATVKVPTVYEVRRALGIDDYLKNMKDATDVSGITGSGAPSSSANQILAEIQAGLAKNGSAVPTQNQDYSTSNNNVTINGASFDDVIAWLQQYMGANAQVVRTVSPRKVP